jgi:hypothetical protein
MSTVTRTRPALRPVPLTVPAERRSAGRAHLTRRGRLALLLVIAALLFTAFSLGRAGSSASGDSSAPTAPRVEQTTVMPGDTLWSVAKRIAPDNDPREVVAQIRELNDLRSSELQVGQQLLLPVAAA